MAEILRGMDWKGFVKTAIAGFLGGFLSENLVQRLPAGVLRVLGEYATPIVGVVIGIIGNYIKRSGAPELGEIIELSGAFMVGNWVWEYFKSAGQRSATLTVVTETVPFESAEAGRPAKTAASLT